LWPGVQYQGNGTIIVKADQHPRPENSAGHGDPVICQRPAEEPVQILRPLRGSGGGKAGAPALPAIGAEGELGNNQSLPAYIGEGTVHLSVTVLEDPEAGNLPGQGNRLVLPVAKDDTQKNEETGADPRHRLAGDFNRSPLYPLQDCFHPEIVITRQARRKKKNSSLEKDSSQMIKNGGQPPLCSLCPRLCGADRGKGGFGYCRTGTAVPVASVCLHHGEEPVISGTAGICNVFFSHCNLQCIYCQNLQISDNSISRPEWIRDVAEVTNRIERLLDDGAHGVGFVSPSHALPRMSEIIRLLRGSGRNPVFVFNTNAYDREETIRSLGKDIGVYLPDFKYADGDLAERWSGASDYPEHARAALKEMFRQKGADLEIGPEGTARS